MKFFILLCLLATICAAQIRSPPNILDQALRAIRTAKTTVDNALSDMKRTRRTIDMDARTQISNTAYQSFKNMNDIINTRYDYIKEKSEEAKEAGKNIDDCLNVIKNTMRTISQTGGSELEACENKAKQNLDAELRGFDSEEAYGKNQINLLDRVSLECYNSNTIEMGNCITVKVALINMDTRQWQQRITQLQRQIQSNKFKIISSQRDCNNSSITKVRNASSQAIYDVADCLKN